MFRSYHHKVPPGARARVSGVVVAASICQLHSDSSSVEVLTIHLAHSIRGILLAFNLVQIRMILMLIIIANADPDHDADADADHADVDDVDC